MSILIKNYVYYTYYVYYIYCVYINIMTVRDGTNQFDEKLVTNIYYIAHMERHEQAWKGKKFRKKW